MINKEKTYSLPCGGIAISDNLSLVKRLFYDKPDVAEFITNKEGKIIGYYEICVLENQAKHNH